jgi:hypothetical protein
LGQLILDLNQANVRFAPTLTKQDLQQLWLLTNNTHNNNNNIKQQQQQQNQINHHHHHH